MSMWISVRLLAAMAMLACGPLCAAATPDPQPAWLDVTLNGEDRGVALAVRDGEGFWLPQAALRDWGVRTEGWPTGNREGQPCAYLVAGPDIALRLDEASQSLTLTVAPARLPGTSLRLDRPGLGAVARSDWGGFLNYDLSMEQIEGQIGAEVTLGGRVFSPAGAGTATFVGGKPADGRAVMKRLETNWTIDDPDRAISLVLGDSIARSGVGESAFRFGGIRFGRSFDEQPGFVTLPGVTLGGKAALPSAIDVYVNDVLKAHRDVRSGPFEISDVPVISGSGDVQLVVRDMFGQQTVVEQSYYTASSLLKRGLDDYSVEFGLLRENYGIRNFDYGPLFASATWRRGLSGRLTVEGHAEASRAVQQSGVGVNIVLGGVGLLSTAVAGSHTAQGVGTLASVGIERRARHVSIGANATLQSADYESVGTLDAILKPRRSVQAFLGFPVPLGSLGVTYTLRRYRGLPEVQIAAASAMLRLGHFGTLSLSGSRMFGRQASSLFQLSLSTALGSKGRSSASTGVGSENGHLFGTTLYQRNLPAGEGIGYSLAAREGETRRVEGQLLAQTATGTYGVDVAWQDDRVGTRLTASGAIGTVDGALFAARRVNHSFAAVRVGDFAGVRVYDDNQLIGRTDRNGLLIDTNLRDFDRNTLRIETDDLPLDALLKGDRLDVRPGRQTGIPVRFDVRRTRDAILVVRLADGRPLPSGAIVETEDGGQMVSAEGGEIYMADLRPANRLVVRWPAGRCDLRFPAPPGNAPQPRIGPLICRSIP